MPKKFSLPALFLLFILITGCAPQSVAPTSDLLATVVAGTLSVIQTNTPELEATGQGFMWTPTPDLSASTLQATQEVGTRYVYTSTPNVNLRVGPGRLFQVSRVIAEGEQLQLLGLAPGNKWMQVLNKEGIVGWVDGNFVNSGFDGPPSPTVTPTDATEITGNVRNDSGPITYLGVALSQGNQFDEGYTDETGTFYIYVPLTLKGDGYIQHYSTDCRSNLMDSNCQCLNNSCGALVPESFKITFPQGEDTTIFITFGWK